MQARMYLPWFGRFASPDPALDQHFQDTQSWNIYSYVRNNPTMKTDPTGMILKTNDVNQTMATLNKIAPNANIAFKDGKWSATLKDGAATSKGFELINKVINSNNTLTLNWSTSGVSGASTGSGAGDITFNINPNQKVSAWVVPRSGVDVARGKRPMSTPAVRKENMDIGMIVAHELVHGLNRLEGVLSSTDKNISNLISLSPRVIREQVSKEELNTIGVLGYGRSDGISENAIREETGNPYFRVAHVEAK